MSKKLKVNAILITPQVIHVIIVRHFKRVAESTQLRFRVK